MPTDAISSLLGESTTTAGIPAVVVGKPMLIAKPSSLRLKKLLRRKSAASPVAEGDEGTSVIPSSAERISSGDERPGPKSKFAQGTGSEPLIPTSVALVAPDTTPDADKPLDPTQVPPSRQAAVPPPQTQPELSTPNQDLDPASPTASLDSLFQFHAKTAHENLAKYEKAPVITEAPPVPGEGVPSATESTPTSSTVAKILSDSLSGKQQPPPDPQNAQSSMERTTEAFRRFMPDRL